MSVLLLSGYRFNILKDAVFSSTPAADALFPFTNLPDGKPETIGKFGSLTTGPEVWADTDLLRGTGGGEIFTGGVPGSPTTLQWVEANTGTGDVTQEATIKNSGNFSIRCAAGSGTSSCFADVTVRSGSQHNLRWFSRADGTGGHAIIRARNITTGKFLTAGGSWQPASANLDDQTGTTFVGSGVAFTVESYELCQADFVTLRVELSQSVANKLGYFDDVTLIPYLDFVSVHGHNIDPRCTVTFITSDLADFSSPFSTVTLNARQPSFYAYSPNAATYTGSPFACNCRYVKLSFGDVNSSTSGPIWLGEWVVGKGRVLNPGFIDLNLGTSDKRISVPRRIGPPASFAVARSQQRTLPLRFRCRSFAEQLEVEQEVFMRSFGGNPLVIVPHQADSFNHVYHGVLSADLPRQWQTRSYVVIDTQVQESAFPLVTG